MPDIRTYFFSAALIAGIALTSCSSDKNKGSNTVTINQNPTNAISDRLAQAGLDKSPMDMAYFPTEYPKLKMANSNLEAPIARAIFSRPQKGGRRIFGEVVKYGSTWRMGANEASELEFFRDVNIKGKTVPKGRYVIYAIPYENEWTIILNNDLYTWGLKIDSTKDAYKFTIPIAKTNFPFEVFTMEFAPAEDKNNMQLIMEWDSIRAILPIKY
ncbi:DUF2911 domain-containing protein [Pseudoflavitalea sp. G-6-1-2]|uniref:DUF2911 domain-containing protein n=1 Tax=Pseudoflavitalea sp. G-6-1-2 TaxID=2728841 RepID=UPI00146F69DF|nr:DUF2911 domain-containing protein [Pseudoflavitalea sp. G-6-1-2]NML19775.1 DUF2911 domain-containing protein [Pseudoflavitalea sp. G-6-1-2]